MNDRLIVDEAVKQSMKLKKIEGAVLLYLLCFFISLTNDLFKL